MPAGVHKGVRVLLTIDRETHARWKDYAESLDMPVASLLRHVLELNEPTMQALASSTKALKSGEEDIENVLGPILFRSIMQVIKDD